MTAIDEIRLPTALTPERLWADLPALVHGWLAQRRLAARDAVLLLPYADLLPPARQAFARQGGWQPRIETPRTLAEALAPPPHRDEGGPSGDAALDRLLVAAMLQQLPGIADWRRRDPKAHARAVDEVAAAALALARAAAQRAPTERDGWWARARAALAMQVDDAAPLNGALARLALEWAAQSAAPASDVLFTLRPAAWIVLQAGGADPLVQALVDEATSRATALLRLQADPSSEAPFDDIHAAGLQAWHAADAEDEAVAAAAAVIDAVHLRAGPVALVAEDRALVRRIRALLERAGLPLADESGWMLSTTRPAAQVMALLGAVHPRASADDWLDAIKAESGPGEGGLVDALEAHWRRGPATTPATPPTPRLQRALDAWAARQQRWQGLSGARRQPLAAWLQALRDTLGSAPGGPARWAGDAAARAVWQALRLDRLSVRADVDRTPLTLDEFSAWVDAALCDASYIPAIAREGAPVVVTPLARALLRPFAAVIVPGADESRLGTAAPGPALLNDALLRSLGIDDHAARAERQTMRFVQLLRHPKLLLVRRRADDDEALGPSRWWRRLQLAQQRQGAPRLDEQAAPLESRSLQPAPVAAPAALAASALPSAVSASAVEALRTCPYRFFARSVLRLSELEELADDPGKRDYGSLLHAALQRFHDERAAGAAPPDAAARLVELAEEAARELGVDGPALLPFRAGLDAFAARYLRWLAVREAAGWSYEGGEVEVIAAPADLPALKLRGRIDRIDRHASGAQQLLDYKTGSQRSLKDKLADPFEDTQLAFYAAQMLSQGADPERLRASYLALDERDAIGELEHRDVAASAHALLTGLADEWARLGAGAPMKALGEGMACEFCEARGLCRRDHWWSDGEEGAP
ncbi:PD-(D/E)XK nuclease family protein [Aquincola sp. S2]|uniref:PD-(D/E)XK nuclease family protein n=1 Tax=Pseudaquabacterium terrae TaxID=2732868 RepID=A0ABX2EN21_9BURK|nr:PD-(D/E)XK nuclease family protein [Aquabacterium terrae]NRF69941.1 PD-(D/E)XK nuclease family protein [Aquabacterium terrae]